jgi:FkbM family methyltransferase
MPEQAARTNPRFSRLLDLASKGWAQGLAVVSSPRDIVAVIRWVAFKRVHLGELTGLAPLRHLIQNVAPKTVIDVGANTGQFSSVAGALLPEAKIYAFEPIEACRRKAMRRMRGNAAFQCFNVALGAAPETREFNVSSFAESSSFLSMSKIHREAFPWTGGHQKAEVEVVTLDSFVSELELIPPVFLKVDVQGFEMAVLRGASKLLESVSIVLIETAYQELYEGQPLFHEIYDYLSSRGFTYAGSVQNMVHPNTGEVLQSDSLFMRR